MELILFYIVSSAARNIEQMTYSYIIQHNKVNVNNKNEEKLQKKPSNLWKSNDLVYIISKIYLHLIQK